MSDERACDDETNNGKGGEVRVGLSSREAAGVAEVLEDLSRSLDTLRRGARTRLLNNKGQSVPKRGP